MWGRLKRPSPRQSLVDDCRADDSELCREVVRRGMLSEQQMLRAASRYRLGRSRSGKTIYWHIDERGVLRDGRIGTAWVSQLFKAREPQFLSNWSPVHCLFGLHLLDEAPVAIVDAERSAVILSELCPQCRWMAYGGPFLLDLLEPLQGRSVTFFPRTDPTLSNYLFFMELADMARRTWHLNATVSSLLEDHATDEQKARYIDLVDFLFPP